MVIFLGLTILTIGYGIFTIVIRVVKPTLLKKYNFMQKKYGNRMGFIIHFIAYSLLPILFGVLLIIKQALGN
jgi:hypothetical protein